MTPLLRTGLLIAALMFAASAAAVALRPTHKLADAGPKVDLEAMIPKQFGDWRVDDSIAPVLPAPDVQAKLDKIYNQTLARTYVNGRGQRVMLSIAYGGDQSDSMQVHLPEVCYAATRADAAAVGFDDARIYREGALRPEARSVRFVKMDSPAALAVMKNWQADAEKRPY